MGHIYRRSSRGITLASRRCHVWGNEYRTAVLLRQLLECYLLKAKDAIREEAIAGIERSGWESIRFGWAGPIDRDRGNYYYLQGASFLIEYDNTQNRNNHIHSVWREFEGDFGEDLIRAHRHQHTH
ncbi:DUF3500 domain-containing protein [Pelagicoccus sp. SDUM812002]|uniref:DUF3500 domain-containing protein n=1 Tax=Pelagicoccus sp. SDUM812002 TaxID=3041266 RepID=UPI0034E2D0E2